MTEARIEHVAPRAISRPPTVENTNATASPDLKALCALAERCGARVDEHHVRVPTNVACNYYDGGRDFDVSLTFTLTFASVHDAARFVTGADHVLAHWLRRDRAHAATLSVGQVELALTGALLERPSALLARVADVRAEQTLTEVRGLMHTDYAQPD